MNGGYVGAHLAAVRARGALGARDQALGGDELLVKDQ